MFLSSTALSRKAKEERMWVMSKSVQGNNGLFDTVKYKLLVINSYHTKL